MNKALIKATGAVSLLLAGAVLAVIIYSSSDHFREAIGNTLSNVLGESIELGDELEVHSMYPRIELTLPNAKLRASGASERINRARLQDLQVSINYDVLFSGGTEGDVRITADNLAIITQSGQFTTTTDHDIANSSSRTDALLSFIARQLGAEQHELSGLDIALNIAELNYYDRHLQAGNQAYHLSNVMIDSLYGDVIQASANVHENEKIKQTFILNIQTTQTRAANTADSMIGTFDMHLASADDQQISHRLQGGWELEESELTLKNLEYKTESLWLRGDASIVRSGQEIGIESDIDLRQWNITTGQSTAVKPESDSPPPRVFPYDVFTTHISKQLNANVRLHLGAVRLDSMPIINGQLQLALAEGVLDVSSENLTLLGGAADLSFQLDNTLAQIIEMKLKLEADDVELARIRSSSDNDTILSRGKADLILALRGAGPSPGHIASGLDGYLIATINNARVKQKYSTLLDVGVVNWAVDNLSLLVKEDDAKRNSAILSDPLTIECASLRMYVNDGRVEVSNGAIIEFQDNMMFSSGYIDLKSETMGFAFRTKNRSLFDWSAISIAKYAEVSGHLGDPDITINAAELAKQGLVSASTVAWGPLPALVYSLAEKGVKNMGNAECTPDID